MNTKQHITAIFAVLILTVLCASAYVSVPTITDGIGFQYKNITIGDDRIQIGSTNITKEATFVVATHDSLHSEAADFICDGADDQEEIQAILNAFNNNSSDKIIKLRGTFNFSGVLDMIKDNVIIDGYGAKIRMDDGSNCGTIHIMAMDNHVMGLEVDGNKAGNPSEIHILAFGAGAGRCTVKDCHFYNSNGDAVEVASTASVLISDIKITDNFFHDCREQEVHVNGGENILIAHNHLYNDENAAIIVTSGTNIMKHIEISNNYIFNSYNGVILGSSWGNKAVENIIISDNYISGNTYQGIYVGKDCKDIKISDNYISNNGERGIHILSGATFIDIDGNIIKENQASAGSQPAIDIYATDITVSNNRICDNEKHGIYVREGAHRCTITNNHIVNNSLITDAAFMGITGYIAGDLEDLIVRGNTIFSSAANRHDHGISLSGSAGIYKNCVVENNKIWGSANAEVYVHSYRVDDTSKIRCNIGYATENSGTATLISGTTSIATTHELNVTPAAGDIMVTAMKSLGNASFFWVDTYTSTHFTIHTDVNPAQDVDFAWSAAVY